MDRLPCVVLPAKPEHRSVGQDHQSQGVLAGRVEYGLSVGRVGFKDAGVERSMRTADDDRRGLAPSDQTVLFGGQRPVVGSHEDIRVHGLSLIHI